MGSSPSFCPSHRAGLAGPDGDSLRPPIAHRLVNGTFIVALWNQEIYDKHMGTDDGLAIYRDPEFKVGVFKRAKGGNMWQIDPAGPFFVGV